MDNNDPLAEKLRRIYDFEIARRILTFVRPYRLLVVLAILSLCISTSANMIMPLVLRRAIDNNFLAQQQRFRIENSALADDIGIDLDKAVQIHNHFYLHNSLLTTANGVNIAILNESSIIEPEEYYVFSATIAREIIDTHPILNQEIVIDGEHAAIKQTYLSKLELEERQLITQNDLNQIIAAALLLLALLLCNTLFIFLQTYAMSYCGQSIMNDLRISLYQHIMCRSLEYINHKPVGKLVSNITSDVETINELFSNIILRLAQNIAIMAGVLVTLFIINVRLGLIATVTLPPIIVITWLFRKWARKSFRRIREHISRINAFLSEHLAGMAVIQMFVRENRTKQRFNRENNTLKLASLGEMYVFATFSPLIDLLRSFSIAAIIFFGAIFRMNGLISLGVLVAFIDLIGQFYQQIQNISDNFVAMQSAMAGSERLFALLDVKDEIIDHGVHNINKRISGKVVFHNVYFSYKNNAPIFNGLSMTINAGEDIAIVGPTGAGKTTVINLLTRLWDVTDGAIYLDGIDIRNIPKKQLRTYIQPIQQDTQLFRATIADNIKLGLNLSYNELVDISKQVYAHHFIDQLPEKYETMIDSEGMGISAGQKQLIAFARIMAHNPNVIIFDEATANIDTETEILIQKGISAVLHGRTSIIIAHRISTIQNADRIIAIAGGKIVEQGTHNQLLEHKRLYYNLYNYQYFKTR